MRAERWTAPDRISLEEVETPVAATDEALVEVLYAGLCGTDRSIVKGTYFADPPLILGHEIVGRLVEDAGNLKAGTHVVIDPLITCGSCHNCKRGLAQYCDQAYDELGITRDGGWAEFIAVPKRNLHAFPSALPAELGAIVEPLTCTMGALRAGRIESADRVLIIGDGQIGMLAAACAASCGAIVDVVGPLKGRTDVARAVGATGLTAEPPAPGEYDLILDAVGLQETFNLAIGSVAKPGRIVMMGLAKKRLDGLPLHELVMRGTEIIGSNSGPSVWPDIIDLLADGRLAALPVIEAVVPLEDAPGWAMGQDVDPAPVKTVARVSHSAPEA